MLLKGLTNYEATFDRLIKAAQLNTQNIANEFNRANSLSTI